MKLDNLATISSIILVLLISGCIGQSSVDKSRLRVGEVEYIFLNNITDSIKIPVYGETQILNALLSAKRIALAFDGSNETFNSYFSVVGFNIVSKLQNYYVYSQNRAVEFKAVNFANETVPQGYQVVLLRNSGLTGVSYKLDGTILVEGDTYKNLSLAGDRLVLTVLQIKEEDLEQVIKK